MSTFAERITKLATRLDTIDTKIGEYQKQREQVVGEMQLMIGDGGSVGQKTTMTSKAKPTGTLGDKIVNWLLSMPGQNIQAIAAKLKTAPNKIGLSLYHLTQKGQVFTDNGLYFASVPVATAAAKTAPVMNEDSE